MATNLTARQAQAGLAKARKHYAAWFEANEYSPEEKGPELRENFDWVSNSRWAIVWEEGPFEWALNFSEKVDLGTKVWSEPITNWAVALYPSGY